MMDRVQELLKEVEVEARGNFLGLLNVLIGRHIEKADHTAVSTGLTWRQLAAILKKVSWDKDWVRELGFEPSEISTRDRGHFWFAAIKRAEVDSPQASLAGNRMAGVLNKAGYIVSRTRHSHSPSPGTEGNVGHGGNEL
jgi:hypothetical protein